MHDVSIGPLKLRLSVRDGWVRVFAKSGLPIFSMRMPVFARYLQMDNKRVITARADPGEEQYILPDDTQALMVVNEILNRPASEDTIDAVDTQVEVRNRRNFY